MSRAGPRSGKAVGQRANRPSEETLLSVYICWFLMNTLLRLYCFMPRPFFALICRLVRGEDNPMLP
jgi:hypothetical protein